MGWGTIVSVGIGGAIGSILRFMLTYISVERFGPAFPIGTLSVNLVGSFLIGVIAELAITGNFGVSRETRTFITVGILGGFTTFSSFSYDTLVLVRDAGVPSALGYVAGSVVFGLLAAYAGVVIARFVILHFT